jgi:hypothetical protein
MATLIGVYRAKGGPLAALGYTLRRFLGSYPCDLSRITHRLLGQNPGWVALEKRLAKDLGHTHICVYPNLAEPHYQLASKGREPCVLIEDDEGKLSMILDWNDLAVSKGDVAKYEQILRSKLLMY